MLEVWQDRLNRLKSNRLFEWFVISIIILSALLIGVETFDGVDPEVLRVLHMLDFGVTLFFVFEISVRFLAEKDKLAFFKNGWNVFDTIIVAVSLMPLDNAQTAVLGRLLRIFRVLRMVSLIPELRMLLNSLIKALPQLAYVMVLMFIIFYIYAAIGSTLYEKINPTLWGNINLALLTLFRVMTFEDWTDVMYETMDNGYPLSWIYYLTFIFFTTFAFLNMVIGIVVNVMEDERQKLNREEHPEQVTLEDLQRDLAELKSLMREKNHANESP